MKTVLIALGTVACTTCIVFAADPAINAEIIKRASDQMTAEPAVRNFGREGRPIPLGKSGIEASGPLVNTFRPPPRPWREMTLPDKLTSIPVVGLFVPQPMPRPPSVRGRYFAWGQSDRAWVDIADHVPPGPQVSLVNFSRSAKD